MKLPQLKSVPALAVGILGIAATTQASLITSSANLPPDGVYLSLDIHQIYGGAALQFLLSLPMHAPYANLAIVTHGGNGTTVGSPADEIEDFPSTLDAEMEVKSNGNPMGQGHIQANGPVETIVYGKIGNVTGTFDTEMLSMSLSGNSPLGPFMIRESPTKQSTGQTKITDIGGGLYQIDSFFDVFTELSIAGGPWMPGHSNEGGEFIPGSETSGRVTLVPEPTSMSLLAAGFVGMMGFIRRRR